MNQEQFEARLVAFISKKLVAPTAGVTVGPETLLFEEGLIDSLQILAMIAFVERDLDIRIPDSAVRLKSFQSVRAIAETFVQETIHEYA